MMKIEKAIEIIENRPVSTHEQFEADVLSIHALYEKQEREKWCEWCNKGLRFECCLIDDNGNTASIENNMVQTCIAKVCPNCGRKIGEKL